MLNYLKALSKDTLIYLTGNAVNKIASFLLLPLYTHFLTPKDFGILGFVGTVTLFFDVFILLGMNGTILRFYFNLRDDSKALKDFLGTIYLLVFGFSLFALFFLELVGQKWHNFLSASIAYSPYIRIGLITSIFNIIPTLSLCYYRAQNKPFKYIKLSFFSLLIQTICIIYYVTILKQGALGNLEGVLIASIILSIIYGIDIYGSINLVLSKELLVKSLKYGLPLIPSSISGWILISSGNIFIEKFSSLHCLGLFCFAMTLSNAIKLIISGFKTAWYPFFFDTIEKDNGPEVIAKIMTIYVTILLFTSLGLNAFIYEIIHFMMDPKYKDSYQIIPLLVLAVMFEGLYYLPSSIMLYAHRTHIQAMIITGISLGSLFCNFLLCKRFGVIGVAVTFALANFCLSLFNYLLGRCYLKIPYEHNRLLKAFGTFTSLYILISILNLAEIKFLFLLKTLLILSWPICLYVIDFFTEREKKWFFKQLKTKFA